MALSIIKEYRKKHRLVAWPQELYSISSYTLEQIEEFENLHKVETMKNIMEKMRSRVNFMENIEVNSSFKVKREKIMNFDEHHKENI